jgi:putative Ca2+/H+ antiporter (TMEM165/GDT1 family)
VTFDPRLFATVFGVIFLAELPDKTSLAALVLATRYRPAPVFLGASLALAVQSIIAVAAGSLLGKLPPRIVHVGSGVLFIGCALFMWFRKEDADDNETAAQREEKIGFLSAVSTTFGVVFVAEWGDLTQIGTAGFQAKYHSWLTIVLASTLALWCVAGIAVFVGNRAAKFLQPAIMQKVAAVAFGIIGVLLLANVI